MQVIADLQLHSKYARAVSPEMVVPKIWQWAKRKGIGLIATGDWTHPLWMREIKAELEETGNGLLQLKNPDAFAEGDGPQFLLEAEVSCIYSQGGKARRIHTLIWSPSIATAEKINKELTSRGCNLLSDGRPIIGLTSIQVAELVFTIDPTCLIIPAHCLLPDSCLLTQGSKPKAIQAFKSGDTVLTHSGTYRTVTEVFVRNYEGSVLTVKPWYFRPGLTVTPEHPFYAIKTLKKCPSTGDVCRPSKSHLRLCKRKTCLTYKKEWVKAQDLEVGDVLLYPRYKERSDKTYINISESISGFSTHRFIIETGGSRGRKVTNKVAISRKLGLLVGYYLAEGYTDNRDSISFCFSNSELEYVRSVKNLMKEVFGILTCREYRRRNTNSIELIFYSKVLSQWFASICYDNQSVRKAHTKQIPDFLLDTTLNVQAELIRGWYRGDKGYTSSRVLMNQLKTLCVRLGIIPSIIVDSAQFHKKRGNHQLGTRIITAGHDNFCFSNFSFFEDHFDLKKEIPRSQTALDRRHGWIDDDYIYLPIKEILKSAYQGKVYNLEVEKDHSYTAEFACVHNCWTPWFSLYGSESGFDSIEECFGPFAKNIYAIETGLSSDPAMNWRIKELDTRAIVSFSDAHSGPKLAREATVFELEALSFENIRKAIMRKGEVRNVNIDEEGGSEKSKNQTISPQNPASHIQPRISYTVEFYPEEGKYHYTGHRNCGVKQSPDETKVKGTVCPVCGRKLTVGVMHRVDQLAGRTEEELGMRKKELKETQLQGIYSETLPNRPPFVKMVPLLEILAEAIGGLPTGKNVVNEYMRLTDHFDSELTILLQTEIAMITKFSGEKVAQAIDKVRRGDISVDPGYDGVFGKVKIWKDEKVAAKKEQESKEQMSLF